MKRTILAGMLVLAAGVPGLIAQKAQQPAAPAAAAPAGAPAGAPKGPAPKSKGEQEALQAMAAAQNNPDAMITACEALLTKFADSDFKDVALYYEAIAYQQKNDPDKTQVFAERAVTANPKNIDATLFLAANIAQRTRENDLDKEDKLNKVDKYSNDALAAIGAAQKPGQITDPQWEELKKDWTAQAHAYLGVAASLRKKYDVAISELKMSVEGTTQPQPAYEYRLAAVYQSAGKYDEAIAMADKVMNDPQAPTPYKQASQAIRAGATVAKNKAAGQSTPPAAPPQK
jgi:tetratricopeptide (TPR) repeat protein